MTLEDARRAALDELDRILSGARDAGDGRELHARASAVVRRYVECLDPAWGPDLTSSELMACFSDRFARDTSGSVAEEMAHAEAAKFGRDAVDARSAELHVRALHSWVDEWRPSGPEALA